MAPDDHERWQRLRSDLVRIEVESPDALVMHPSIGPPDRPPPHEPVEIHLSPGALEEAVALHEAHGDYLSLHVGALPYPPGSRPPPDWPGRPPDDREALDPAELTLDLMSPVSVASGQRTTHKVRLTNRGRRKVEVHTCGFLIADIVDAAGTTVGGFSGALAALMRVYPAPPSGTVEISMLVGTSSYVPELGYAIPPGSWHLVVPLDLADGRRLVSPPLAFEVTG